MSKVTERNSSHKLACHLPIDSVWRQLWARDTQHKRLREISIRLKWVITLLHKIVSLIWHCQEWSHGYSHLVVQARALKSTIGQSLRDRVECWEVRKWHIYYGTAEDWISLYYNHVRMFTCTRKTTLELSRYFSSERQIWLSIAL